MYNRLMTYEKFCAEMSDQYEKEFFKVFLTDTSKMAKKELLDYTIDVVRKLIPENGEEFEDTNPYKYPKIPVLSFKTDFELVFHIYFHNSDYTTLAFDLYDKFLEEYIEDGFSSSSIESFKRRINKYLAKCNTIEYSNERKAGKSIDKFKL